MAKKVTVIDIGDEVLCDLCNEDFTVSAESGGFVFGSNGVCPKCADRFMEGVIKHGEEAHIVATCPPGKSFADFIREFRGPEGSKITITSWGKDDEK